MSRTLRSSTRTREVADGGQQRHFGSRVLGQRAPPHHLEDTSDCVDALKERVSRIIGEEPRSAGDDGYEVALLSHSMGSYIAYDVL